MAYEIRLGGKHPYNSMLLKDPKMTITRDWKTIAKKTDKLKEWESKGFVQIKTIKNKKDKGNA